MRVKYSMFIVLCAALLCHKVSGQEVAVKTNLLYDVTATVNAGVEVGLARRWTLDVSADYNGWTLSGGRKWKHWLVQPEARFWFCDRFAGHFLAVHALGGQYNTGGLKNNIRLLGTDFSLLSGRRCQGWFAGAGVAYGYAWILGRHWNLEAELGVGYAYSRYDSFPCAVCGSKIEENMPHHYWGITKAAISMVYVF